MAVLAVAVLVDWMGPYGSIAELKQAASEQKLKESLYLAIGSRPSQTATHIQYIGITTDLTKRFNGRHPIQVLLKTSNLRLYVGQIASQAVAGRRASHQARKWSQSVYLAEGALAFLMEVPLNKDRRCSPPKSSVVIVSRWYRTDFTTRRRRRPHPSWPDLVEYDGYEGIGDLAWHGRRRQHLNSEKIAEIARRAREQLAAARKKPEREEADEAELALIVEP